MSNPGRWLVHELRSAAPAAAYFFVAFQVIAFTDALMLEEYGVRVPTFLLATVAALVAAKVVLILDMLPVANRFAAAPLYVAIAWKTLLCLSGVGLFKYLEQLVPLMLAGEGVVIAHRTLLGQIEWPRLWSVSIWMVVVFAGFCAMRELGRVLGRERLRNIFIEPPGRAG